MRAADASPTTVTGCPRTGHPNCARGLRPDLDPRPRRPARRLVSHRLDTRLRDHGADRSAAAMSDRRPTVVVADDHAPRREKRSSRSSSPVASTSWPQAADAAGAIACAEAHDPDVCLLDISMPGNGITAAHSITRARPDTSVVMLTVMLDDDHLFDTLPRGRPRLSHQGHGSRHARHRVAEHPRRRTGALARDRDAHRRTPRRERGQRRVHVARRRRGAALAPGGRGARPAPPGIADERHRARRLFISQVTVRTHIASILKKSNTADRDEAIRMFDA